MRANWDSTTVDKSDDNWLIGDLGIGTIGCSQLDYKQISKH